MQALLRLCKVGALEVPQTGSYCVWNLTMSLPDMASHVQLHEKHMEGVAKPYKDAQGRSQSNGKSGPAQNGVTMSWLL